MLQAVTNSWLPAVPLDGVHEVVVELVLQEDALGVHLHEVQVLQSGENMVLNSEFCVS